LLGVSRSWLYDAAKSGRIPCVRLGGDDGPVRFRRREIEAWLDSGRPLVDTARAARHAASLVDPGGSRSASRERAPLSTGEQLGLLPRALNG
jgi:excisionase family DNA binding protein